MSCLIISIFKNDAMLYNTCVNAQNGELEACIVLTIEM